MENVELTPQCEVLEPHTNIYQEQEDSMTDYKGEIQYPADHNRTTLSGLGTSIIKDDEPRRIISSVIDSTLDPTLLTENVLSQAYSSNVQYSHDKSVIRISRVKQCQEDFISVVKSKGAKSDLIAERLAKVFGISVGLAVKTLNSVTRLCPRNTLDISLKRRYSTNDMLRYNRMLTDLFMDTMFSKKPTGKSVRGYTCCQVFATEFG